MKSPVIGKVLMFLNVSVFNYFMKIVAITGLPGSGKSFATDFFVSKGFEKVYFGGIVVEEVKKRGMEVSEANERKVREELRKEHGMAAMAILSEPKIQELLKKGKDIVIDDLMSWQEFVFLKQKFSFAVVLAIFASPQARYERLAKRKERSLSCAQCIERDKAEIEVLQKGGTISMADFTIINEGTQKQFESELKKLLKKLK